MKGERAVESSNRQGNYEGSSNSAHGSHQPIYEDASRETSIAAMPFLSSGAGSSASLPSPPETNLPGQSLPAFTNMPRPLNAEEGEPDTEVPQGEMPRAMDPFSELVEEKPNDKRKCNYCGNEYVGGAKRMKVHFAGVRSEALETLKGERAVESSNLRGNDEGSSNPTQGWHQPVNAGDEDASRETISAAMPYLCSGAGSSAFLSLPETNQCLAASTNMPRPLNGEEGGPYTEVPNGAAGNVAPAEIQPGTRWIAHTAMASLRRKVGKLISSRLADINKLKSMWRGLEEAYMNEVGRAESQPGNHRLADQTMTSPSRKLRALAMSRVPDMYKLRSKWRRMKEEYWSVMRATKEGMFFPAEKLAEVEELSKEIEEICLVIGRVRQEVIALARRCKRSASWTVELVGKEARRKVNVIFSYLMQDTVSIIGVYGMGGVGKTAILGRVYNRLHEDLSWDVFWVAVPQDFSVYALQEEIANAVGLDDLSNEKDVKRRAGLLYGHLNAKNRSVLILDGLWSHFEVKDVGIPAGRGNLKLVVTTRSLEVCSMMPCQKQIKIEVLDMEDSWRLFLKTLCFAEELPKGVEQIARSLLDRCYGLPLGIIEIATRMRVVETAHELRGVLGQLEDSWMGLDVLKSLQLSYLNLGDEEVQQCFLHLVLCFGEEKVLSAASNEVLIESFIDEGLLGGSATRQGLHDRGNAVLDKITRACPLDAGKKHLHPLIKDMALHTMTRTTHLVKAYMGLKEIPEEVFWTDRLEKVFLQGNKIEEIPCAISPNCPKLRRLSLNDNATLRVIHESFFRHLKGLTVLDLSDTGIAELPSAVCQLESLEALLLGRCDALRFIPYVGKLGSLRKLDLQGCGSLEEAPEGMEMLVNLRYLDLDGTGIETLSEGVLGKLVDLQYLAIKMLRAGEAVKSTKVDEVYCSVANVETFNACVGSVERNNCRRYRLAVGAPDWDRLCCVEVDRIERYIIIDSCDHIAAAASVDGTCGDGCALLPRGVQSLELSRCHKMERVMEWERLMTLLPNLKEIITYYCEKLEEITRGPFPSGATCCLTYIDVDGCNSMKRVLLTQDVLLHLPFLQEISVKGCKGIEVIIGTVAKRTRCSFPKLMKLCLLNLPELKSICDGTTCCGSLRWIYIENCPKLKRIPLQLPLLDNGLPSPPPSLKGILINRQTWESLEWDHPLARSSLQHLVEFVGESPTRLMKPWRVP